MDSTALQVNGLKPKACVVLDTSVRIIFKSQRKHPEIVELYLFLSRISLINDIFLHRDYFNLMDE